MAAQNSECKICRRLGQKLFLKGERCVSVKCAMIRKSYSPGPKGKRRHRALSEYGVQLQHKQKVKAIYGLRERQFRKYVFDALSKKGSESKSFPNFLVENLESRLDNAVFRLGFAKSRAFARQIVTHGHILLNKRRVNRPSYCLKIGDIISVRPQSQLKKNFSDLIPQLKKHEAPSWLSFDKEKLEGKIISAPNFQEANIPVNLQLIAEFYSR